MAQMILKYKKSTKKITISKSYSAQNLCQLIAHSFGMKERIIGVTDSYGKFYDLEYVSKNMSSLGNQTLCLVTTKDINQDNMSFASSNCYDPSKADEQFLPNETEDTELPPKIQEGFIGSIADLNIFEQLFLNENEITVVVCYEFEQPILKIPHPYYTYKANRDWIIIYHGLSKTCDLYLKDWRQAANRIASVLNNKTKNSIVEEQPLRRTEQPQIVNNRALEDSDSSNEDAHNEFHESRFKENMLQNLKKLYEQETVTQLEFYKLKAKLFENPRDFLGKYQGSRPRGVRRRESVDPQQLRSEIVKSKQEKYRYQSIINEFRSGSRQRFASRGRKHQIPIIVRKYNNVIEKISTSYPLSIQQQQTVNLISELQLKGLISEKDSGYYKSLIIQEEAQIFQIFMGYFNESFDQIELSKKLKQLKQRGFHDTRKAQTPEQLMRLIVKHAKRNSFELLRKLALESNSHLLKCFDNYKNTNDNETFINGIERIANYYRAKDEVAEFVERPVRF